MAIKAHAITKVERYKSEEGSAEAENLRLRARIAELEKLVAYDTLTPLFNRRHFMAELDRWCARANRNSGQYGLIFIDVDNMKSVNDTLGHGAGDALLQAISASLLKQVRKNDLVARIGGDEFAILLDNIKACALAKKTNKIIASVAKISEDFEGHIFKPRISAGFTELEPGVSAAKLMQRADRSMYAAKKAKLCAPQASAR